MFQLGNVSSVPSVAVVNGYAVTGLPSGRMVCETVSYGYRIQSDFFAPVQL
jgi:hypothetical protein